MLKKYSPFPIADDSDFSIYNLPYGIFSTHDLSARVGVALGNKILDLSELFSLDIFSTTELNKSIFLQSNLNDFISLGRKLWLSVREDLIAIASDESHSIWDNGEQFVIQQSEATMHLPVHIGDYSDFFSSLEHATNTGKLFRDPESALFPNWKHLPVAYHGPIHRPTGQTMPHGSAAPVFGPSRLLDFELEMAFIVGVSTQQGERIAVDVAEDHIFGMVLFNDWSARDIQKWESVPLGPFLSKSFASSISPWIVTMDALAPFKTERPDQDPEVLPYLQSKKGHNYDISLEVLISNDQANEKTICVSNYKYMYWSMAQQLAHHTVGGCNINVGDMMASGTISGKDESSYGSLLEITHGGKQSFELSDGSSRTFIQDGDTITMRGYCQKENIRVGFGEVRGTILPHLK